MIQMRIGNPIEYAVLSIMGICVVLKISIVLAKNNINFLSYIGENSMLILEWHYYVFLFITIVHKYMIIGTITGKVNSFVQYYSVTGFYRFCLFFVYVALGICVPLAFDKIAQMSIRKIKKRGKYNYE